jgi:hypothetical protein
MSVLCLVFTDGRRDEMERLAYWATLGDVPVETARAIAAGLSLLPEREGRRQFDDLMLGIRLRDGIEGGDVHPDEVGPEFHGDEAGALAAAETRVEDALTALTGSPS